MSLLVTSSLSRTDKSPTAGEEDEAEEDDEEWLSCLEGVFEVDKTQEDELGKPGTTIGTKFSVLQIIRTRHEWDVVFDHFVGIPFSSQSFPSDNTAGVLPRTFKSRIFPILWHTGFVVAAQHSPWRLSKRKTN